MALARLNSDEVYRFYLASPFAFTDWENPTAAEFNANPTNDPGGEIWNITCALNTDGTTFDLGDPTTDDSLTFCQKAGNEEILAYNPEIVLEIERAQNRWITTDATSFNTANLAFSLLAWRGVEYYVIMSIGEHPDESMAVGHRIKMARIATDYPVDVIGTGENIRLSQTPAFRSELNWNYEIAA